jgi:hypothetical protein
METPRIEFNRRLNLYTTSAQFDAVEAEARRRSAETGMRVTVSDVMRALMQSLQRNRIAA